MISVRIFSVFVGCILLFACCEEKPEQKEVHDFKIADAYEESFFGKNIRCMIRKGQSGLVDTTFFDKHGNIVSIPSVRGIYIKRAFNDHHFKMRELKMPWLVFALARV